MRFELLTEIDKTFLSGAKKLRKRNRRGNFVGVEILDRLFFVVRPLFLVNKARENELGNIFF